MDFIRRVDTRIEELGGFLFNKKLKNKKAATLELFGKYAVFIDTSKMKNKGEEFLAKIHEYGHCKTGCTHQLNTPFLLIGQHETRANRAAVHEFLPYDMLMKAVDKGNKEPWELADALGLPEKFVRMAVETYKVEGKLN